MMFNDRLRLRRALTIPLVMCAINTSSQVREQGPQLAGIWLLRTTRATCNRSAGMRHSQVVGRITLASTERPPLTSYPRVPEWTHVGHFVVDWPRIASGAAQLDTAGTIVAALGRADAVKMVLNPDRDHGALVLRGRWSRGDVVGEWTLTGYFELGHGCFMLRRLRA